MTLLKIQQTFRMYRKVLIILQTFREKSKSLKYKTVIKGKWGEVSKKKVSLPAEEHIII